MGLPTLDNPEVQAAVSTVMPEVVKIPFFSTTVGRAMAKILVTAVMWVIAALVSDSTVAGYLAGFGGVNTILSLFRDFADSSIPNLPSSGGV